MEDKDIIEFKKMKYENMFSQNKIIYNPEVWDTVFNQFKTVDDDQRDFEQMYQLRNGITESPDVN